MADCAAWTPGGPHFGGGVGAAGNLRSLLAIRLARRKNVATTLARPRHHATAAIGIGASVPVLASGGIANGKGLAAALSLGAQGVSLGTRFLCSEEAFASPAYKERVARAAAGDTVYTKLFNVGWDASHRVLRNRTVAEWHAAGRPADGARPGEGAVIGRAPRGGENVSLIKYASNSYPSAGFEGDIDDAVLYAGESCSLIDNIKPAAEIVSDLVSEAEQTIRGVTARSQL